MAYDPNNIFARIINGEISCNKVFEDEQILAFHDISKAAPTHILVIPKGQYSNFSDFTSKADEKEIVAFFKKVGEIAQSLGLEKSGYRLISNSGADASQSVAHFHVHIIGGKKLGGLVPGDQEIR